MSKIEPEHTNPQPTVALHSGRRRIRSSTPRPAWLGRVLFIGLAVAMVALGVAVVLAALNGGVSTLSVETGSGALAAALVVCAIGGYRAGWSWTGFGPPRLRRKVGEPVPSGKTLWDLLQLVVIPGVLVFGVWWLNDRQATADRINANRQATATTLAANRQATATAANSQDRINSGVLDAYLDRMSDLLLVEGLGSPHPSLAARTVARARTMTALRRLDPDRRDLVLQFLAESHLAPIVSLDQAELTGVRLTNLHLENVRLDFADLRAVHLVGGHLVGAHLDNARLVGADLENADLSDATLKDARLSGASLRGAELINARLNVAQLGAADLTGATLVDSALRGADLADAQLSGADLAVTQLNGADLAHAHLTSAYLTGADLTGANLADADLTAADLSDSNLTGAKLTGARLLDVIWSHTRCPDRSLSNDNGSSPESCVHHLG